MIAIRKLRAEQFERLADIFDEEFASDPPDPANSEIFAAFEDGKLAGFVLCEKAVIIGQIYVAPERRNSSSGVVQKMLSFLRERFDGRETVAAVASERRFENLFRAFGMQKIEGSFFRKNIDL